MIVTADREVVIVIAIDQTAAVIPTTTNVSSDKDAMCFCVIVKDTVCVCGICSQMRWVYLLYADSQRHSDAAVQIVLRIIICNK